MKKCDRCDSENEYVQYVNICVPKKNNNEYKAILLCIFCVQEIVGRAVKSGFYEIPDDLEIMPF